MKVASSRATIGDFALRHLGSAFDRMDLRGQDPEFLGKTAETVRSMGAGPNDIFVGSDLWGMQNIGSVIVAGPLQTDVLPPVIAGTDGYFTAMVDMIDDRVYWLRGKVPFEAWVWGPQSGAQQFISEQVGSIQRLDVQGTRRVDRVHRSTRLLGRLAALDGGHGRVDGQRGNKARGHDGPRFLFGDSPPRRPDRHEAVS